MISRSLDLAEKVAIVTGAGRGLGRAEAVALATRGARIVTCDLEKPLATLEDVTARGSKGLALALDLTEPNGPEQLVDAALSRFGKIDIVVNNAGIVRDGMSFNLSLEDWDAVIAVNLTAPFALSRLVAGHWRSLAKQGRASGGVILNTSSESGLYGNPGQSNYAAAKAGVAALTVTLAAELSRYGVRVNAIAPRARTDMSERAFGSLPTGDEFDPFAVEHVAAFVAWLASPSAGDVTGHVFVVHGGAVELLAGWRPVKRIDRDEPWTDAELAALRERLFDDWPTAHLTTPVRDLFVPLAGG